MSDSPQDRVAAFLIENELSTDPVWRTLDLVTEVGEFAKAILLAADYGTEPVQLTTEMREELADLTFSTFALIATLNLNADELVEGALDKYQERIHNHGSPGSGGQ